MSHSTSEILMGSHGSSDLVSTCFDSDPASFPAGLAVRQSATVGALSLSSSDGQLTGVSLGVNLSDTKKTAVARAGNKIPLLLTGWKFLAKDELTFYTKTNVPVSIEFVDGGATAGAEVVTVTVENEGDEDEYNLISVNMDVLSTATQCKTALDASADALALILTIITGTAGNAQAAFAEDEIDGAIAVQGVAVRVSNSTGKAVASGGTLTGACYASDVKNALSYDYSAASLGAAAYIDMGGGL